MRLGDQLDLREHGVLVDRVEERAQPVDVVELAGQRAGQVEAEAVDVALGHPVAQRVHDQPQHAGVARVERVARPRVVHVEARVVGDEAVVAGVVDALEGEHRPQVVALGGVVVDDVEDHLDPRPVQRLDHALELAHLVAVGARRRVQRVRREVADRAVAPVVDQPLVDDERLVGDVVDGQQLDRSDAELLQVGEGVVGGQPGVGAAQVLPHAGMALGEALDVGLVDDRLRPRRARRAVVLPVEGLVDDQELGDRRLGVLVVGLEVGVGVVARGHVGQRVGRVPPDRALDRLGVGVDEQLGRVEAVARLGVVDAVDAVAVARARPDAGQIGVPVERCALAQLDARLVVLLVEEAQLHALGVLAEQREVRPVPVPV